MSDNVVHMPLLEASGLLWGYRCVGNHAQPLTPQAYQPQADAWSWFHYQAEGAATAQSLRLLGLSEVVIAQLLVEDTRPKLLPVGDGYILFLRAINKNPDADPDDMVSLRIWLSPQQIVSVRRLNRGLRSVQNVRTQLEAGSGPSSVSELLCTLLGEITAIISDTVNDFEDSIDDIEFSSAEDSDNRTKLMLFRRQVVTIRRYLAPLREAVQALARVQGLLTPEQSFAISEFGGDLVRNIEELDLCRERALVLQDEIRNTIAEQQGERLYVLSIISVVFLPLSFLTGVFGMNVAGLPGLENPNAFTTLSLSMLVIGAMALVLAKLSKWL